MEIQPCVCPYTVRACVHFDKRRKGCQKLRTESVCTHPWVKECDHVLQADNVFYEILEKEMDADDWDKVFGYWIMRLHLGTPEVYGDRPAPPVQLARSRRERIALMRLRAEQGYSVFGPEVANEVGVQGQKRKRHYGELTA